jgi:hypothetical protein
MMPSPQEKSQRGLGPSAGMGGGSSLVTNTDIYYEYSLFGGRTAWARDLFALENVDWFSGDYPTEQS